MLKKIKSLFLRKEDLVMGAPIYREIIIFCENFKGLLW